MTLGERVRARREQLGLSLAQVGDAIGVSRQAVSQLEQGLTADISTQRAQELARVLQCRLVWLITETGPMCGRGEAA